jgi:hypothetical protein
VLSRYPHDGVGMQVSQTRWGQKGIADSYWLVTRTKLKSEGQHGKAWGKLYWKGMCSSMLRLRALSSHTPHFTHALEEFPRSTRADSAVSRKLNINR